jgi:hypothetical protein
MQLIDKPTTTGPQVTEKKLAAGLMDIDGFCLFYSL